MTMPGHRDERGFAAFFRCWYGFVWQSARRVLPSDDDTDDVTQEVFLRLLASGRWRKLDNPRAYLSVASRRVALSFRSRVQRETAVDPELLTLHMGGTAPRSSVSVGALRELVAHALTKLPPRCSLVCRLVFLESMRHADVAKRLGISRKAVEKQVARGR